MGIANRVLKRVLDEVSRPAVSRTVGRIADLRLPRPLRLALHHAWVRAFRVDLSDTAQPLERFASLDDLFTRRLVPGARPVARGRRRIVSPVDGRLLHFGPVDGDQLLQVKGVSYSLAELLGDPEAARRYERGTYFTLYLSPPDYHRVHAPADGEILGYRYLPGRFYPVNRLGLDHVPGLFPRNERLTTYLRTPLGHVAVVKVGATSVGRITVTYADVQTNAPGASAQAVYYARPRAVNKGAELGTFHLGSTVVLLVERPPLAIHPSLREGMRIRVGQELARQR